MNTNKINTGIFFISIGLYILLYNLDILSWSLLPVLAHLWPLFLISLGIQIILNRHALAKIITIIITIALIFAYGFNTEYQWLSLDNFPNATSINAKVDSSEEAPKKDLPSNTTKTKDKLSSDSSTSINYRQTINPKQKISSAELTAHFESSPYRFEPLDDTSLMAMSLSDNDIFQTLSYEGNQAILAFDDSDSLSSSENSFSLNQETLWRIDVNAESTGTLDLSHLKIESLHVDSDSKVSLVIDNATTIQTADITATELYIHLKDFKNHLTILNANEVQWQKSKLSDAKVDIGDLQATQKIILEVDDDCRVYITE